MGRLAPGLQPRTLPVRLHCAHLLASTAACTLPAVAISLAAASAPQLSTLVSHPHPAGGEDFASIHAAQAVEAGEKWICTRWFKELDP